MSIIIVFVSSIFEIFSDIDLAISVLVTHINKASKFLFENSLMDFNSSAPSLTIFSIGFLFLFAITKSLWPCFKIFLAIP